MDRKRTTKNWLSSRMFVTLMAPFKKQYGYCSPYNLAKETIDMDKETYHVKYRGMVYNGDTSKIKIIEFEGHAKGELMWMWYWDGQPQFYSDIVNNNLKQIQSNKKQS